MTTNEITAEDYRIAAKVMRADRTRGDLAGIGAWCDQEADRLEAAVKQEPRSCGNRDAAFRCTLNPNHDSPHESADTISGDVLHRWGRTWPSLNQVPTDVTVTDCQGDQWEHRYGQWRWLWERKCGDQWMAPSCDSVMLCGPFVEVVDGVQ